LLRSFGLQVDVPHAYACADGMVYDVTEWVLCQVCTFILFVFQLGWMLLA